MSLEHIDGLEAAAAAFEADYERFYVEGESKPRSVGRPRLLSARPEAPGPARLGVLLIHGYMAAPEEPALLAERLSDAGAAVYLPRLPGHGTGPDNLAVVGARDWLAAVDEAYGVIRPLCERVVIAGFSTGASLALAEAARHPDRYAAVVSMSAPLRFRDHKARWIEAADILKTVARRLGLARIGYNFIPNHPDNPDINYARNCIHGMAEVKRVSRQARRGLERIRVPVLAMQGSGDSTIAAEAPALVAKGVSSADARLVIVPSDRHGIVRGPSLDATSAALIGFLRDYGLLPA